MIRLIVATLFFVLLLVLAGCAGIGSVTSESGLLEEAEYEWNTTTDVRVDVEGSQYTMVLNVSDRQNLRIFRRTAYGDDRPIGIRAVQFRYPNGTILTADDLHIHEYRSDVIVELPSNEGQLAFTAPTQPKQFSTETFVEGSYEIVLPEDHRIDNFILGTVRPGGFTTEMKANRVHITWEHVTSRSITVRYYLARDLYLFSGLVLVVSVVGIVALGYVWRQVKALQRKREGMGLDVDTELNRSRRPPPGFR